MTGHTPWADVKGRMTYGMSLTLSADAWKNDAIRENAWGLARQALEHRYPDLTWQGQEVRSVRWAKWVQTSSGEVLWTCRIEEATVVVIWLEMTA